MQPVSYTQTGVGTSPWFMPNFHMAPFSIDIECGVTGTATYSIEITMDDYWTPPNQVNVPWSPTGAVRVRPTGITAATTNQSMLLTTPCRGWRVNVTAGSGSVAVQAVQAGIVNYG